MNALIARLKGHTLDQWKYNPAESRRDLRLDFLRGLFLVYMIIYHFHRAWLIRFTYESFGTVSSAEGFVFLSGMVVGLVYLPILKNQGMRAMVKRVWRRAFHLYLADVVTLTALVSISLFVIRLKPLGKLVQKTPLPSLVWSTITLHLAPLGFDILLLYIGLLLFTPLVLWLIYKGQTHWVIAGSVTLYILYRIFPETFAWHFLNKDTWRFPIILWQVLFVGGILTVTYRDTLHRFWHRLAPIRPALIVAILFLAFFAFRQLDELDLVTLNKAAYKFWFDKPTLGIGRLVNAVVLAIVTYWFVTHFWQPLSRMLGNLLIPLGQASLYVFIVHLFIAYVYRSLPFAPPLATTGIYELLTILFIWFLVRKRFLFHYVPH